MDLKMKDKFKAKIDTAIQPLAGERDFKTPTHATVERTEACTKYLSEVRGLSAATLNDYGVCSDPSGRIVLRFYDENLNHALNKFRQPRDVMPGEPKATAEKDGKPVLFGSHLAKPESGPLVITAGEYDAMALYEAGVPNAVSLPFGDAAHQFFAHQSEWIKEFETVIFWMDNDGKESTAKAQANLARRIGKGKVKLVRSEFKDANDALRASGKEFINKAVESAEWYPVPVLYSLADVEEGVEVGEGTPSGHKDIDLAMGGFREQEVTDWAGDNHAGKTTNILNVIVEGLRPEKPEDKTPILIWTGEEGAKKIQSGFENILAGPKYLKAIVGKKTGRTFFYAKDEVLPLIRNWYRDYVYILDDTMITIKDFFEMCEVAVKRFGVKAILVDNLMAFTSDAESGDYLRAQGRFAQSCKAFAKEWDVHIHLVTHNKKTGADRIPDKYDVEGSLQITNWADNVIQVYRPSENFYMAHMDLQGADAILSLCKCRGTGVLEDVSMVFCPDSRRIVQRSQREALEREVGWEAALTPAQKERLLREHAAEKKAREDKAAADAMFGKEADKEECQPKQNVVPPPPPPPPVDKATEEMNAFVEMAFPN